jgi:hypothetical protein
VAPVDALSAPAEPSRVPRPPYGIRALGRVRAAATSMRLQLSEQTYERGTR